MKHFSIKISIYFFLLKNHKWNWEEYLFCNSSKWSLSKISSNDLLAKINLISSIIPHFDNDVDDDFDSSSLFSFNWSDSIKWKKIKMRSYNLPSYNQLCLSHNLLSSTISSFQPFKIAFMICNIGVIPVPPAIIPIYHQIKMMTW